jgi:hypothetical protein
MRSLQPAAAHCKSKAIKEVVSLNLFILFQGLLLESTRSTVIFSKNSMAGPDLVISTPVT